MDCISLEGKVTHISLLTHPDKLKKLEELFAKSRHKADVFLPNDTFYSDTVSTDDPERMADLLFKWLGIKHRSLNFHFDPNQEELINYKHDKNTSKVTLGWHCLEDSLVCGGAVAHAIVHHLLIARAKISLGEREEDEALADLGTIYAGFGVIILNSFESKRALGSMAETNYASEFIDYCKEQRIVDSVWQPFVLPAVATEYLDKKTQNSSLKPFIRARIRRAESHHKKLVLAVSILIVFIAGVTVLSLSQPKYLSVEMQEKRDSIALLKAEYEQCQATVKRKQETWDQSDIFIQRQIDADKTRCSSLKNRYNYEVNDYNSKL